MCAIGGSEATTREGVRPEPVSPGTIEAVHAGGETMTAQALLESGIDPPASDAGAPRRRWWTARRFGLIAYALPVTIAVLATMTWFSWGKFAAFLDVPPFVHDNMAGEVTSLWNHQTTGAGSTSTPMLSLAEVLLDRGVTFLGLPAAVGQWLLYALCFGLCAFGASYLAAAWVRRPWAVAAAGLLATFNTYLLVWVPIPLPALAIGLGGLLAGMVVRAAMGRRIRPIALAAATLPASYLALNPPWLLMAVLTVLAVAAGCGLVGGWPALRRVLATLGRAIPWAVLFNLWWVVPLFLHLVAPAGSAFGAVIDIRNAAQIQSRARLMHVVTLGAHWAWNAKGILIYADALDSGLRVKLRWALPLLAFVGLMLADRRRRRAAWLAAGVGLVMIVISTGLRSASVGQVNLWLYDHVPGMWLLRDPAGKLGAPIVLLYASFAALALDRIADLSPRLILASWLRRVPWSQRLSPSVLSAAPRVAAAGVVLAALAYPSPMWTGAVVPDSPHGILPSARVAIPDAWHRLADTVNAEPGRGKAMVLPVNLYFYAFKTDWGYSGVDVIPAQLLKRPTLRLAPGGYFQDLPAVQAMLVGAQNDLLLGRGDEWRSRLRALGVDTVIVRHDLVATSSIETPASADPAALDAALGRIGGLRSGGQFGVASLYHVADPAGTVSAGTKLTGVYGSDASAVADAVAGLPPGTVAVTDPNRPVDSFRAAMVDPGTVPFTLGADGSFRVARGGPDATYRAAVRGNQLTLSDADTVAIDGRPLPSRPALVMNLADKKGGGPPDVVGLDVGGNLRPLPAGGDSVVIGQGTKVTAYAVQPGDGLTGPFRKAVDCEGTPGDSSDPNPLHLAVASKQQCAVAPVQPTPGAVYRVRFSFRAEGAAKARVCLWQDGPAACALLPSPPVASGWADYTAFTRLSPDILSARLYLYADATADSGGVAEFRDVTVSPLGAVGDATLSPVPASATELSLSKGKHTVTVDRHAAEPANDLPELVHCTFAGSLFPRYPTGNRWMLQSDGSVTLDAPRKGACAEAAPMRVVPGATYRFSADYRGDFGQTPRICLRQDPSARCADLPALARVAQWQTVRAIVRPDFGTTVIRPQLATGESDIVPSRATFRNLGLTRVSTESVSVTPLDQGAPARIGVTSTAVSPAEYRVAVNGAAGPFTVVLADSYAPGWSLDGLPEGWSARHVTVNGYANGWLVEGTGNAVLTAKYRPERLVSTAMMISILAGVVAVALVIAGWAMRNGRWRAQFSRLRRKAT
jgi:arabinofuranan 3-O-arabinosyltransferase